MQRDLSPQGPRRLFADFGSNSPWASIGLPAAVGIAYCLAARVSLSLLMGPDGIAVFWPAAGIGAGVLIAYGTDARWPVAVAVTAASFVANLLSERNIDLAAVLALFNGGQAVLIAGLITHRFGPRFSLDKVRNVVALVAATTVGTAAAGFGGAIGLMLFHDSGTSFLSDWLSWAASDALGVLTVAPPVIWLIRLQHDKPAWSEVAEGSLLLALVATLSALCFASPKHYWFTILPGTSIVPLLLWLAARCRPVFAAAGALIVALAIVGTITLGVGVLGDASVALADRVYAAQAALLVWAVCTLVLAAAFAERREYVSALKNSNYRLQLALDCAELGTWSLHLRTGQFENDARDRHMHGHGPDSPPQTLAEMRRRVHPDDLSKLDSAFLAARAGGSCRTQYRLAPRTAEDHNGRERWVALEGLVVRDAAGQPVQLLAVTSDITERKHAEAALQESERVSRELLGALPAAIYVVDAAGRITYCNEAAVNLWGARPRLGQDRWSEFSRFYNLNGTPMAPEDSPTQMALAQGRVVPGREAMLERADGSRVPIIHYPAPLRDARGALVGVVTMLVDISARKQAEQALAERNAQLALAGRAALVGSYAYDVGTDTMRVSEGYAAIHGLPEGTSETTRSAWRGRVFPEDVARLEGMRRKAFRDRRGEYNVEYRILPKGPGMRWIESRSFISFDDQGHPQRVIGVNIDVTDRKQTEAQLKESKLRLADALAAGQVMAFEWDALSGASQRSENAADILGSARGGAAATSRSDFLIHIHPDDAARLKQRIRRLHPGDPSYTESFRYLRPDGEQVWLEEIAKGEFDAAGKLLRIKGLTRNITERKRTELALQASEAKFAGILAIAGDAIVSIDAHGRITLFNDAAERLFGFTRAEMLEQPIDLLIPPRFRAVHRQHMTRFTADEDTWRRMAERQQVVACRKNGDEFPIEASISKLRISGEWVYTVVLRDVTDRKRAEERQRVLVAELDHRVKNVLATVSAVISHTQQGSRSLSSFVTALDGRIRSMASTHELLSSGRWQGIRLAELVRRELAPYATANNTEISGRDVVLRPEAGQAMAMVLHELATNAAKYGALSTKKGRVAIRWDQRLNGHARSHLVLEWHETGGPPVVVRGKPGFGTSTIRDLIPYEFGGSVDLVLAPEGVRCRVELPGDWLGTEREPVADDLSPPPHADA